MPLYDEDTGSSSASSSYDDDPPDENRKGAVPSSDTDYSYSDDEASIASSSDCQSDSDEEVWQSEKARSSKRKVALSSGQNRQRSTQLAGRRTKAEEYEGVTDSESSSLEDECEEKSTLQNQLSEIPFVEKKGWNVEAIIDYKRQDGLFLVKWKHRSYREASWENRYEVLAADGGNAGTRRKIQGLLDRIESRTEEELEEEREKGMLYCEPEKVIGILQRNDSGNWYLIKWRSLPYKECTWESEDTLFPEYQTLVDAFLARSLVQKPAFKRPKFFAKLDAEFTSHLEYVLREYQVEGVNWLTYSWFKGTNVILADEMGLGKTIQSVVFLSFLHVRYGFLGPSMIVVPLSTIDAWQREFTRWAPSLNVVVYNGDADSRRFIRHYELFSPSTDHQIAFDCLLITYELVMKDKDALGEIQWKLLIVDEGHRLKNSESQLFDVLNSIVPLHHRVLITGTPLQNSLKELWSLLNFLNPKEFSDYDAFSTEFSPERESGNTEQRMQRLHALLKPYLLRRLKKDVEKALPSKREQILRVELCAEQRELYKLVLSKNYIELQKRNSQMKARNLANILGELKKICNHPFIFQGNLCENYSMETLLRASCKLYLLDMLLARLLSHGHRVLIFSQSTKMLDILEAYLSLKQLSFQRIDGSVPSDARRRGIDSFNASNSPDSVFLLSTRAGGLGINLETADTVIIYDSDWNPQNDLQAMARAHRIGQTKVVNIYRLVCSGTVEETILERAKQKMVLDHLVIQRINLQGSSVSDLQEILKFGAKALFEQCKDPVNTQNIDLDTILKRAQEPEEPIITNSNDLLEQFQVADVQMPQASVAAWDQIIPERERLQAEQEAAEQELFRRESALQEAILTSSKTRRARNATTSSAHDKSAMQEALRKGRPDTDVKEMIEREPDDKQLIGGVKVGLLKHRIGIMSQLDSLLESKQHSSKEQLSFRLAVKLKPPTNWSIKWMPKDDSMLLLGVWRHGFCWDLIRNDPELALPYTLQRGTLPQPSHLLRRIDYILSRIQSNNAQPVKTSTSARKVKKADTHKGDIDDRHDSIDWSKVKLLLKPAKRHIEFITSLSRSDLEDDDNVQRVCEAVKAIGLHVSADKLNSKMLWNAIARIWPSQITAAELEKLYGKLSEGNK